MKYEIHKMCIIYLLLYNIIIDINTNFIFIILYLTNSDIIFFINEVDTIITKYFLINSLLM